MNTIPWTKVSCIYFKTKLNKVVNIDKCWFKASFHNLIFTSSTTKVGFNIISYSKMWHGLVVISIVVSLCSATTDTGKIPFGLPFLYSYISDYSEEQSLVYSYSSIVHTK